MATLSAAETAFCGAHFGYTAAEVLIFAWAELEGATAVPGEDACFEIPCCFVLTPHRSLFELRG